MTDRRYSTARWARTRKRVLDRDGWRCWVSGCDTRANVADHIEAASVDMTDAAFFDPDNLRASCQLHNLFRGHAARLARDTADQPAPRGLMARGIRFRVVR